MRCSQTRRAADSKKLPNTKKNGRIKNTPAVTQQRQRPCCFASSLSPPLRRLAPLTRTAHTWEIYHNEYLMWRGA